VNLLGIGEIGRTRYGKVPKKVTPYRLAYKLGYADGCRYVVRQCENILDELTPVAKKYELNLFTLLYWEQMLGNWGVVGNTESDIAIEELDPFDSHLLYELFLGVDDAYTRYNNPVLFREMIRYMWPELLASPINPPCGFRARAKRIANTTRTYGILKELAYQRSYRKYISSASSESRGRSVNASRI
jgi:hypothetical protein